MIERIRKKYAMTEKGARDYVSAVFWSVLVNISKMLPVGVLATALSGIVEALTRLSLWTIRCWKFTEQSPTLTRWLQ